MWQSWWQRLLGIEAADWAAGGRWSLEWLSAPSGDAALLAWVAGLAVLAAIVAIYYREGRRLSFPARTSLLLLRLTALAAVAAMLLEPVLVFTKEEQTPSHLLVLVDGSQSMDLRDTWTGPAAQQAAEAAGLDDVEALSKLRRSELAARVLERQLPQLAADGKRIVHVHSFAEQLGEGRLFEPGLPDASAARPDSMPGRNTAVGVALRQALASYRGLPLSGVLLISDGQSNAGEPPESAAEEAARRKAPIVSLAMGTPEGPRNAAIDAIQASPVALAGDDNTGEVLIRSRGLEGEAVDVIVEQRVEGGPWQEIARESLVLQAEGETQQIEFPYASEKPRRVELRARLGELGPELTVDDNSKVTEVRFVPPRIRVLFIAGSTFPEVQFVRAALMRDSGVECSTWNMSADPTYEHPGDKPIRRLPSSQEELNEYDCVILYDVDPDGWPASFPELLEQFVTQAAGGLVYIAGEMQAEACFQRQSDPALRWLRLLPVVREPGLFRSEVKMELSRQTAWKLQITPAGRSNIVLAFSEDGAENQRILESLPGMYWHFPVTRAKAGATVLATHGDPRMRNEYGPEVLLATQRVGPGRTYFVGFDSTYRWRFLDESAFDGFWGRIVDRAGRAKQLGGEYPFRLRTDKPSYQPGELVQLRAKLTDEQAAGDLDSLQGEVELAGASPQPLSLLPDSDGQFEASFPVPRPGQYTVRVWAGDGDADRVKSVRMQVVAELPSAEYEAPGLDRPRLEGLGRKTGGKVFDLSEAAGLPQAFTTGLVTKRLEDRNEIWSAPLLFGLLLLTLSLEWIVRKRCQLV